jgi:hypothetical protein
VSVDWCYAFSKKTTYWSDRKPTFPINDRRITRIKWPLSKVLSSKWETTTNLVQIRNTNQTPLIFNLSSNTTIYAKGASSLHQNYREWKKKKVLWSYWPVLPMEGSPCIMLFSKEKLCLKCHFPKEYMSTFISMGDLMTSPKIRSRECKGDIWELAKIAAC